MAFPKVVGHPDYTRDGDSKFIPEVWSGKILVKFYDATVLGDISNNDYEGEIKRYGDTVIIRTLAAVSIKDYVVGQALIRERPNSTATTLTIDKGKYWDVELDDVMDVQSDIDLLDKWTTAASEQMKIEVDTDFLEGILSDVASTNKGNTAGAKSTSYTLGASGAPLGITKTNVLDYIVDCGSVLDESNIPETGRWMVIPTWMAGQIKKSDLKDASMTNDSVTPLRNGKIGMIDRFTLYQSNLLHTDTDGAFTTYNVVFGHKLGLTFASQITETETIRSTDTFADIVRGLNVYGYKCTKTDAVGIMYCRKAA